MGKLGVFSGREVCRILSEHGFQEIRQRGNHIVMQRRNADTTVTVPVPNHREIRTGTLLSIIRKSQLPRGLFEVG